MGISRIGFLIDKKGIARKVWPKVKPDGYANEVLDSNLIDRPGIRCYNMRAFQCSLQNRR